MKVILINFLVGILAAFAHDAIVAVFRLFRR